MASTDSSRAALDRMQRKASRILLGHTSRSPTPSVLAELGWHRLYKEKIDIERLRLLRRIGQSSNPMTNKIAQITAEASDSWIRHAADLIHTMQDGGMPTNNHKWATVIKQ